MPKVDPSTHEPMTDAPDAPEDQRGGRTIGDPAFDGATVNGGNATKGADLDRDSRLPGEKDAHGEA